MFNNNKGFSLVEVIVAAGIMGALALGIAQLTKNQAVVQKRAETGFEINTIYSAISQTLLNSTACGATLGVNQVISDGRAVTEIRNRRGDAIFDTVTKYGNNTVRINSMTLSDFAYGTPNPNIYGEVTLNISFEKTSSILSGHKTILKKFPLKVEMDSGLRLIKCYSATENAVETAKQQACESINGVYDNANSRCDLRNFIAGEPIRSHQAVSTRHLSDYKDNVLDTDYVNVTGDTMTGKLTVGADIESSTRVCVGGRCRNFAAAPCPAGQVVREIRENGSVVCSNLTCAADMFFVGVNADGTPICKPFPTSSCGPGQFVSVVNPDGTVQCESLPPGVNKDCSPGVIQKIDASGNVTCKDIEIEETNLIKVYKMNPSCGQGQGLTLDPTCANVSVRGCFEYGGYWWYINCSGGASLCWSPPSYTCTTNYDNTYVGKLVKE